jgi:hypothetical protein
MENSHRANNLLVAYFWGGIALALFAYTLPWLVTTGASLSLNAHDLAEWVSLHPMERARTPELLTSLFLRLQLVHIGLIIAFCANRPISYHRGINVVLLFVLVLALLPPVEFLAGGDINYQQQLALAAATLFGGLLGLRGVLQRLRRATIAVIIMVGIITTGIGLLESRELLSQFRIQAEFGVGGATLIVAYCILLYIILWLHDRQTR